MGSSKLESSQVFCHPNRITSQLSHVDMPRLLLFETPPPQGKRKKAGKGKSISDSCSKLAIFSVRRPTRQVICRLSLKDQDGISARRAPDLRAFLDKINIVCCQVEGTAFRFAVSLAEKINTE